MKFFLKNLLSVFLITILLLNVCSCNLMKNQEIPTETSKKASVSLPKDWRFVVENGKIYIKEAENTVATEVYNEWRIKYYLDGKYYDNKNELNINSDLPEELQNLDNYEVIEDDVFACDIYRFNDNGNERYAIYFTITNAPTENGAHVLFLVFESEYSNLSVLQKITKTYKWGGTSTK